MPQFRMRFTVTGVFFLLLCRQASADQCSSFDPVEAELARKSASMEKGVLLFADFKDCVDRLSSPDADPRSYCHARFPATPLTTMNAVAGSLN